MPARDLDARRDAPVPPAPIAWGGSPWLHRTPSPGRAAPAEPVSAPGL